MPSVKECGHQVLVTCRGGESDTQCDVPDGLGDSPHLRRYDDNQLDTVVYSCERPRS